MTICTLTDAAKQQIDTICKENEVYAVTLNMKGGGCAGFEYQWGTYAKPDELLDDDEVFKTDTNCTFVITNLQGGQLGGHSFPRTHRPSAKLVGQVC